MKTRPYRIHVEHRVRADHPLRAIKERSDFAFVQAHVAQSYGHNGNASVNPAVGAGGAGVNS